MLPGRRLSPSFVKGAGGIFSDRKTPFPLLKRYPAKEELCGIKKVEHRSKRAGNGSPRFFYFFAPEGHDGRR
jgi:hypothetical protein